MCFTLPDLGETQIRNVYVVQSIFQFANFWKEVNNLFVQYQVNLHFSAVFQTDAIRRYVYIVVIADNNAYFLLIKYNKSSLIY